MSESEKERETDQLLSRSQSSLGGIQKPRGSPRGEGGQAKKPRKTMLGEGVKPKTTRFSNAAKFNTRSIRNNERKRKTIHSFFQPAVAVKD